VITNDVLLLGAYLLQEPAPQLAFSEDLTKITLSGL
jgi:hypothetical protein